MELATKQNSVSTVRKKQQNFFGTKKEASFFSPAFVQPKLTIGPVDDPYEREADAMADKVMRMSDTETLQTKPSPINIQKKCEHCDEEEKLQRKENGEEDEQMLQMKPIADLPIQKKCAACEQENIQKKESAAGSSPAVSSSVNQTLQSSGQRIDRNTQAFMESRFGYDFGNVQIHNDPLAHQSSSEINALAYTHGQHIVFANGQYQPNTDSGKQLLAHELTHVLQQDSSKGKIQRDPDPAFSIEGTFAAGDLTPNFIFFDNDSPSSNDAPENALSSADKTKIKNFAINNPTGISLFGFASEEGNTADNTAIIARRIQAIKNVLISPPVNFSSSLIVDHAMLSTSKNHFNYRFWRAVEMKKKDQPSSRVQSPSSSANRGLEDCSSSQKDNVVKPARDKAVGNMNDALNAVKKFKSDRANNKNISDALRFAFHSDSDSTAEHIIDRLKSNIKFLDSIFPILHCGTDQSVDCGETAEALTDPSSITLCKFFFSANETDEGRTSTLVHESSHGSKFQTNDRAYRDERVINILTTPQALDNAESMAIFVEAIISGTAPTVGPTDEDIVNNCGTDEALAKAAVAWSERWNTYAVFGLQQTYGNDRLTGLMAPHINFYFGRSDRSALAGILDKYLQMMSFFSRGAINIECVDRKDPLYNTWKIAQWNDFGRTVRISNEQLHKSYLNADDRVKYIYGALAVDRFHVPEEQRMAYPNVARAYKLFFWQIEG